jgi:hypothetical protein
VNVYTLADIKSLHLAAPVVYAFSFNPNATSPDDGCVWYIGKALKFRKRLRRHVRGLRQGKKRPALQAVYDACDDPGGTWRWVILHQLDPTRYEKKAELNAELLRLECEAIRRYRPRMNSWFPPGTFEGPLVNGA